MSRRFCHQYVSPCPLCDEGLVTITIKGTKPSGFDPGCVEHHYSGCSQCHNTDWDDDDKAKMQRAMEAWS